MALKNKVSVKSDHDRYKDKVNKELYQRDKLNEKQRKQERLTYLEIISQNLNLPPDVVAGAPVITMNGRNAVYIENHKRILEYNSEKIRIATKISGLCIEGKELKIAFYTKEELKITGQIRMLYYE